MQEITDHTGTITAIIEIGQKLITCGIDKNLVIYDINKKEAKGSGKVVK